MYFLIIIHQKQYCSTLFITLSILGFWENWPRICCIFSDSICFDYYRINQLQNWKKLVSYFYFTFSKMKMNSLDFHKYENREIQHPWNWWNTATELIIHYRPGLSNLAPSLIFPFTSYLQKLHFTGSFL